MNHITITADKLASDVTLVELTLTRKAEADFKKSVFPFLFDGQTSGSRSVLPGGKIRYNLLVYDTTLIQVFKQVLFNAMLIDNGQMN